MIGAESLIRSSPVTRPTASSPSSAESLRCASCASMRAAPRRHRGRAPSAPRARGRSCRSSSGRGAPRPTPANAPCRQADLDCTFRAGYCGVCAGRASALMALGTARAPGPAASLSASAGHEMRVAAVGWRARRAELQPDVYPGCALDLQEAAQRHAGAERSDAEADAEQERARSAGTTRPARRARCSRSG